MASSVAKKPTASASDNQFLGNLWIINPVADSTLILLTPLLLLVLFSFAHRYWTTVGLTTFATVLAMGHYLPGMMRAYGDRELFQRFKLRFILAPIVLTSLCVTFAYYELHSLFFVTIAWGAWHWMMQAYGFARIYDAKAKSFSPKTAWLDYGMCLAWFGIAYMATDGSSGLLRRYYESGGPLISGEAFHYFRISWGVLTGLLTLFYIFHSISAWRAGHSPSPLKFLLMGITIGFYYYVFSYSPSPLISYALFEGYHDIQYLTIVWVFNRRRAESGDQVGAFTKYLFRKRGLLIFFYIALCILFGSYDYVVRTIDEATVARIAYSLITSAALLHFYFDGFIWKVRETSTRKSLGVETNDQQQYSNTPWVPAWAYHGALWMLFLIPVAGLGWVEAAGVSIGAPAEEIDIHQAVIQAYPYSPRAHFNMCGVLIDLKRTDEAIEYCMKALKLRPDYDIYLARHADLLLIKHRNDPKVRDQAISEYRLALRTMHKEDAQNVHCSLGTALWQKGDRNEAMSHFEQAMAINPNSARAQQCMGMALSGLGKLAQAAKHYRYAYQADPESQAAKSGLSLVLAKQGMVLSGQGRLIDSITVYRESLDLQPKNILALSGLAWILATSEIPTLRDGKEALTLAAQAAELTRSQNAAILDTLAAAYAETGQFAEAISTVRKAIEIHNRQNNPQMARQVESRLQLYRSKRAYRMRSS